MPELPEVETVVRSIARLAGRRILAVELRCPRLLRGADPEETAASLRGRRIAGVRRFGKFILIDLDRGHLLVHLGMTGRLLLGGRPGRHTHGIFTLDRGVLLYEDSRQFGRLEYCAAMPERLERLGPEPLEIACEEFYARLHRRRTAVKALLLNQDFVRGVGNIYADESLFRAGIHPRAAAWRLRKDRVRRLWEAVRQVLAEAIEAGGSSISDYVDAEGRRGFFQISHRVYGREGEPCTNCGAPIRRLLVAQRSSHFCPACQRR